jgi:hypothetical protein
VNFYFVAHEDDWQLFMNPDAYHAVQDKGSKSVFVYVTAGDAGLGVTTISPSSIPFFVARENGANAALRFMADVSTPSEQTFEGYVFISGHALHRVVYKNTISYFLRLPDGNGDGSGFSETHHWSLEYFRTGRASSAKAIDGSASYESWRDLVDTVRELIATESAGSSDLHVNMPESDTQLNVNTHPDHRATSLLAQAAIEIGRCVTRRFYLDYTISSKPINLSPEDLQIQAGVFAVTVATVSRLGYQSTWDDIHRSWIGRQYLRVDPSVGCGR